MAARQGTVQKIMAQVLYLVGKTCMAPDTPCCPQNGREESRVVWEGVTPSRAHSEPPVPATRVPTPPRRGQEQWSLYAEGGVAEQNRRWGLVKASSFPFHLCLLTAVTSDKAGPFSP